MPMTGSSIGGDGPGQMGGGGDQTAKAVIPGAAGKIPCLIRGSVGRINMNLKGNFQLGQHIGCFPDDGQITVAAHDDSHFFHIIKALLCIIDGPVRARVSNYSIDVLNKQG